MAESAPTTGSFLGKFLVLRNASRELWLTFVVKFLGVAAYKVTTLTLVLWLSYDFGYGDQEALWLVAAWSLSMTVVTLLVGSLTDAIGLRRTFFLGVWICVIARAVMAFSTVRWLALAAGLFPLAVGEALGTPVLVAAVRHYSTTRQRSIAFSLFYTIMNLGFMVAAFVFDWVREGIGERGQLTLPLIRTDVSSYRTLLLVALGIEVAILPVLCLVRKGAAMTDEGLRITPETARGPGVGLLHSIWRTVHESVAATIRLFGGLLRQSGFYRLLAFLLLIAFLKLIFMQMDYVFPKFGIRELGEGAPVGRLVAINNILIVFLVPLVGALTQRFTAYQMVIVGGAISAVSVFVMALPTAWFQAAADSPPGQWIGHGYLGLTGAVHPWYVMITLFVVLLSVGEAFYSPRVYEYAASIAPKGQEASYSALSYVPFLLAKLLVGTVSGSLLAKYCPEEGVRRSGMMWLIVGLIAAVAPLGLFTLRRFIRVPEAGRDNDG
ncbi:MAG: MFS transporter [Verrucomicrobiae bacterium]|nr:MFS transporter [Verrucomicrobiae bacterium]MCP5520576.1 MFS transporter [Verrucomicrobiales bacterium]